MPDILGYAYLFPLGILISIVAMTSGVSGSNFWIPVYFMFLRFDPRICFWLALVTMLFGFGSGAVRYYKQGMVNMPLVMQYLKICVPVCLIGSFVSVFLPTELLILIFVVFVTIRGLQIILDKLDRKTLSNQKESVGVPWFRSTVASLLLGLVSTGLGIMLFSKILSNRSVKSYSEAMGTTVMICFVCSFVATVARMHNELLVVMMLYVNFFLEILIWVVPGVIVGGLIAPKVSSKINPDHVDYYIGFILLIISGLFLMHLFM